MLNYRLIAKILGGIVYIEMGLLFGCTILSFFYEENDLESFILSTLVALGLAMLLNFAGRNASKVMSRRDGYMVVCLTWIVSTLVGMLPYLFSSEIPGFTNAFFESMSGVTSTGSTVMDNIESCPHALLFWRSLTQWIGGLGIILFTLALLPGISMGGNLRLFAAQCTGPLQMKVQPRIAGTAKWIFMVYLFLTVACAFCLFFWGHMTVFDSINHAFTCIGTGGFSTHQDSIAFYHSHAIEYILIVFMFLAGVNYNLLYFFGLRGKFKTLFKDTEFKWYTLFFVTVSLICALSLYFENGFSIEESLRASAFQVISLSTSTGYCSNDYMLWAPKLLPLLFLAMFIGGCSGSSAGGFKTIRVVMLQKLARNEIKKIMHPNAVFPLRISGHVIATPVKITLGAFTALYFATFFAGWLAFMFCGVPFEEAAVGSISCLSNMGPGLGSMGPVYSWNGLGLGAKWVASLLMFVGRLELLSVYVLFTRAFWKSSGV